MPTVDFRSSRSGQSEPSSKWSQTSNISRDRASTRDAKYLDKKYYEEDGNKNLWFVQMLDGFRDLFFTPELSRLWRRHLVYSKRDGKELITLFTQRYAALTTMTTLMIGTQVAILFSPAKPSDLVRTMLLDKQWQTLGFWTGLVLFINISVSICALICVLTAWALTNVIGPKNAHIVLRSRLFLYACSLPAKLCLSSIYIFVVTMSLFFFVIATWEAALPMMLMFMVTFLYIMTVFSAAGRVLLYSGAMGEERIVERDVEYEMSPEELNQVLLEKVYLAKQVDIHPRDQYRIKYQEQLEVLQEGGALRISDFKVQPSQYLGNDYADLDEPDEEMGMEPINEEKEE